MWLLQPLPLLLQLRHPQLLLLHLLLQPQSTTPPALLPVPLQLPLLVLLLQPVWVATWQPKQPTQPRTPLGKLLTLLKTLSAKLPTLPKTPLAKLLTQ